jgi:hypothetical protein
MNRPAARLHIKKGEKTMNDTYTAATQALDASGPDQVENRLAVRADWSPENFALQVERETQMRSIMHDYMQKAMKAGHHYYSFKEGDKPAITQEGAHAICSLLKCVIGRPEINETYHDDGHLSVRARVSIFNQDANEVATGDGICSTRESKYAYRWAWDNEIPKGMDVSQLKSKSGTKKGGGQWTQYQMPNQDLPDLYNTVLKMAVKRAKVAAVRQLPLVSELFIDDSDQEDAPKIRTGNGNDRIQKSPVATAPGSDRKESVVKIVCGLVKKLIDRGAEMEDLAVQFLPEGIANFEDLSEEQALEIQPAVVELLKSKLKS